MLNKSRWDGNRSWTTAGASIMSTTLTVSQLTCTPKCATNSIMSIQYNDKKASIQSPQSKFSPRILD